MEAATTAVTPVKTRCAECCVRCLGGVPYASLVATLLCFSGVALFCGCGHEALSNAVTVLEEHFRFPYDENEILYRVIDTVRLSMYGSVACFLLMGLLLFTEGFFTTGAVNGRHGDFKTTACGRCISALFIALTYLLTLLCIAVLGAAALPVLLSLRVRSACRAALAVAVSAGSAPPSGEGGGGGGGADPVCVDLRQFGILPWNHSGAVLCEQALENMCNTEEFILAHHLFIVAYAGAGATVIAMIHYLMVLTANWGYVKMSSSPPCAAAVAAGGGGVAACEVARGGGGDTEMGDLHNGKEAAPREA